MSSSCPLNFKRVDENSSRLNALFVSSLVILYLYTSLVSLLFFLLLDAIVKLFVDETYSPLHRMSKFLVKIMKIKNRWVDGGAKRLAGFFGLSFIILLIIGDYLDIWVISLAFGIVFLSCSLMDVFFSFCIGCKIYYLIKKVYPSFMSSL